MKIVTPVPTARDGAGGDLPEARHMAEVDDGLEPIREQLEQQNSALEKTRTELAELRVLGLSLDETRRQSLATLVTIETERATAFRGLQEATIEASRLRVELEHRERALNEAEHRISQQASATERLAARVDLLETELASSHQRIEGQGAALTHSLADLEAARERERLLVEHNASAQKDIADLSGRAENLVSELTRSREETQQLKSILAEAKSRLDAATNDTLETQLALAEAKAAAQDRTKAFQCLMEERVSLEKRIAQLQTLVSNLEGRAVLLEQSLAERDTANTRMQQEVLDLTSRVEHLHAELSSSNHKIENQTSALTEGQSRLNAAETRASNAEHMLEVAGSAQELLRKDFAALTTRAEHLHAELARGYRQIEDQSTALMDNQKALDAAETRARDAERMLANAIAAQKELQRDNAALTARTESLDAELASTYQRVNRQANAEKDAQAKLSVMAYELAKADTALAEARRLAKNDFSLQSRLAGSRRRIGELEIALQKAESRATEVISTSTRRNAVWAAAQKGVSELIYRAENIASRARAEARGMADSLAEAEIKLGALKGDLAERGLALAEAQAAARERTEANNHLMVELLGADKRLSESVVALAGMGQQIIDLRFKEERLSTELANRSGEIAIAQQAQLNALSIQERLNNQLNLTKSSNAELRKELSALNEELSMRQSELVAARQLARNAIDALAIVATPIAAATPNKWRRMLGSKE